MERLMHLACRLALAIVVVTLPLAHSRAQDVPKFDEFPAETVTPQEIPLV